MIRERLPPLKTMLVPFSLALGIMLSPESLIVLGQQAGAALGAVFFGLTAVAVIHCFTARAYGASLAARAPAVERGRAPRSCRHSLAVALPLAARLSFALWGITAFLVTAGYVFNETFWRAYPNLGFSFTLLALLVALNLFGTRLAGGFQVLWMGAALAGLLALIIAGFQGSPPASLSSPAWWSFQKSSSLSPVLLFPFLGYELSGFLG